jgi:hypothetical protein
VLIYKQNSCWTNNFWRALTCSSLYVSSQSGTRPFHCFIVWGAQDIVRRSAINRGEIKWKFWNAAKKNSKYPLKYRKIFYRATGDTRTTSLCYQLPLGFVLLAFKFKFRCIVSFRFVCYTTVSPVGTETIPALISSIL